MKISKSFKKAVSQIVRSVPRGKVMTYGQVAALVGYPRAAQAVGWTLHFADQKKVPFQRIVSRFGGLASGYTTGGREAHKKDLAAEGVKVGKNYKVDLDKYQHFPEIKIIPLKKSSRKKLNSLPFLKGI